MTSLTFPRLLLGSQGITQQTEIESQSWKICRNSTPPSVGLKSMGTLIRYTKINNSKAWQPLALEKPFKYIYVIIQSKKKYGKYFSSFPNFLSNIFPKALAQGNIQRKLEKREKYAIFFE